MSSTYQFNSDSGVQIDTITNDEAGIRLQVNRHGAEPISLARRGADGQWTGFLYRDADTSIPKEGWKNHATLMGFFIHRLKEERSSYRGHEIRGSTHSFLRHKDFEPPAVDAAAGTLIYRMGPGQYAPEEYPYKAQMDLTYTLVMAGEHPELLVTFEFENLEPELSVHVSFGLHPGFAVSSLVDARVILPPGVYIRHMAPGNFLSGETVRIEHPGGPMPFDKADLPGSFLLELAEVPERIFTVEDPGGHRKTCLDYQEAPYLTLWSDGHDFICVEPCWGLPDHQEQRPFEEKEGLQEIAPGKKLTASFAILPRSSKSAKRHSCCDGPPAHAGANSHGPGKKRLRPPQSSSIVNAVKGLEINLVLPDSWQHEAVTALRQGRDVVVDAPTGAGKTFIFELLQPALRGQAVYTVPTRALANDKLAEWRRRGWDVGIATGDLALRLNARVVVATLETQKGRLLRGDGPRLLVVDEYQMLADPVRGVNYELSMALAPPDTQLLLLSGSVSNAGDMVDWLRRIGRDAVLVSHKERPVPLTDVDLLALPEGGGSGRISGFWPRLIAKALHANLGPILVFAPRRNAAEELAIALAAALPPDAPLALSHEQETMAGSRLAKLLRARVAWHHSGMSYAVRAGIVEPLAKNGHLRVVVATMGLAAGINFSMRSVVVTDTRYLAGSFEREVQPDELLQMFGRAGRRGLDESGYVLSTPRQPRLHDGRARRLRRVDFVDWPALLAVMRLAAGRGDDPFAAAVHFNQRLFTTQPVPLGIEHSVETGPMPCGLRVDEERARFARRGIVEMRNSRGEWQPLTAPTPCTLGAVLVRDGERWRPLLQFASGLDGIGTGNPVRLRAGREKIYGREYPLATVDPGNPDQLHPVKWLRKTLRRSQITRADFDRDVLAKLPALTGGGALFEMQQRGPLLVARIDYSALPTTAIPDAHGAFLRDPPTRENLPEPCRDCPELDRYCRTAPINASAAFAWRRLGLVERDGTPTERGVIFSFFNNGEGLAIAAAIEDASYPIDTLIFDLANLRAGHRFAEDESPFGGRLGALCQQVYERADHPGYLEMGVPVNYGAGASEVVRELIEHGGSKSRLLTASLRPGDIERALVEWRSLVRHIALAPDHPNPRWTALKAACAKYVETATAPPHLPDLLPAHTQRRVTSTGH